MEKLTWCHQYIPLYPKVAESAKTPNVQKRGDSLHDQDYQISQIHSFEWEELVL